MEQVTMSSLIEKAIAGGISQSQIDLCLEKFPSMQKESWWIDNAKYDAVGAVKHRLNLIDEDAFREQAAKWTSEHLEAVVADHKRGLPVDSAKLSEAAARGMISMSQAMNSDF